MAEPTAPQAERNRLVFTGQASWANSEAADTAKDLDVELPDLLDPRASYVISVRNPSTETALTVRVKNKETLDVVRHPEIASFAVPANTPEGTAVLVEGWLLGEGARLTLSNDTAIGVAGAFTAHVSARRP